MKRTIKHILTAGPILGVCLLAASRAEAQAPQTVSYSGVEIRQGATKDNGTTTVIKAPARYVLTTQTLLEDLARDETTNGTWFNTKARVPANAELVAAFPAGGDFSSLSFTVVSGAKTVAVSNILSAAFSGTNVVNASIFNDNNGQNSPPFASTDYLPYTITYDATAAGGTLRFSVTGLAKASSAATKPNAATGIYSEKDTFSLVDGTGGGVDRVGVPFMLNGVTATASGSAILNCGCGSDEQNYGGGGVITIEIINPIGSFGSFPSGISATMAPPALDLSSFNLTTATNFGPPAPPLPAPK